MFIAELVIVLAMVVVLVRAVRSGSIESSAASIDSHHPVREIMAVLLLLMALSFVRVWREPAAADGWWLLAFNVGGSLIAFSAFALRASARSRFARRA